MLWVPVLTPFAIVSATLLLARIEADIGLRPRVPPSTRGAETISNSAESRV
jgi:hypothetical protein